MTRKLFKPMRGINISLKRYFCYVMLIRFCLAWQTRSFSKNFKMNTYMQTNVINLLMQKCVCEIPMPTVQCCSWIIRIIQVYVLRKYRNQMLFMNIKNHSRQCVQEVHKSNAKVLTCYCNRCFDISRIQ